MDWLKIPKCELGLKSSLITAVPNIKIIKGYIPSGFVSVCKGRRHQQPSTGYSGYRTFGD